MVMSCRGVRPRCGKRGERIIIDVYITMVYPALQVFRVCRACIVIVATQDMSPGVDVSMSEAWERIA